MKVKIEKPSKFYEEVGKLISSHYKDQIPKRGFATEYPIIYGLYLEIAALGLREKDEK